MKAPPVQPYPVEPPWRFFSEAESSHQAGRPFVVKSAVTTITFVFIASLACCNVLYAQQRSGVFEHFLTDDGLSSNGITTMLHDSRGFMWFGTASGLNQYDGYRFTNYRNIPLDSTSLAHNWIDTIYEDRAEIIWVGTREGLDRFDPETGTFTHYRHEENDLHSLSDNSIRVLYEDRAGDLWVGTENGGLNMMDRSTGRFERYRPAEDNPQSLRSNTIFALYEDQAGDFWVGTRLGLDRLDRATGIVTHVEFDDYPPDLPGISVYAFYEDRGGTLWMGTSYGLASLDSTTGRYRFFNDPNKREKDHAVFALHEDRAGRFWIGSNYGLDQFDPATGRMTPFPFEESVARGGHTVLAIDEDPSGVLWFGTEEDGLYKLSPAKESFDHYTYEPDILQSLSAPHVRSIYEDRTGVLWFGTRNGLDQVDPTTGVFTHYRHEPTDPKSLSGNDITAIHEDQAGALWVVAYDAGVNRLDRATGVFTRYKPEPGNSNSLSSKIVRALYESPAEPGVLWIGTKKGLDRLNVATGTVTNYRHDADDATSIVDNSTRVIYEDHAGMLWIGTDRGLSRFDRGRETFTRYRYEEGNPNGLSNNEVRSIYEDHAGTLWVGTKAGLNKFLRDEERFVWYTVKEGLPNSTLSGIVEDDHGHLWLFNNQGISKFDPARETFRTYDHSDGLRNSISWTNACIRSRSGYLLRGGNRGVDVFHPDSLRDNPHVPPIVITDFKKQGRSVSFDKAIYAVDAITLSHTENFFSFEFAALDYSNPAKNQYAYKLAGLDTDWVYAGASRSAQYTNVDPGDYMFLVKGSNNDGLWNEQGISVRVVIKPPFWRTWVFRVVALLGFAGLLYGAYAVRVRSITRHNQALQKEVAERMQAEADRKQLIAALEGKNIELEEKNTALETNNAELEARNAEMERFTYTVSHDLKTPLVTIGGFLSLLKQDAAQGDKEGMERDIEHITSATRTMQRLLDELLELSRVGRLMSPPEEVLLTALAHEAVELAAGHIAARGAAVEIEAAMPVVYGDRVRLLEVYQNLIDNAIKFMGEQDKPRIEIGAWQEVGAVVCYVRDNGVGIDPAYHEKVFGLFNRLDQQIEGTGIGLALVKRIVEVHGGRVWVESEGEGRGATFWFTLPRDGE